ncbi:MAG: RND family efflux transporter MFP subunit [Halioglobus sp.]|jgi:RND family efflux transporter MFP subunit
MKNITTLILLLFLAISCGEKPVDLTDVAEVKAELKKKKDAKKVLETEITVLGEKILELEPKKEKAPLLITTQTLEATDFKRMIEVQASVKSDDQVSVSSETGGRLLSVQVKEGQYVKRGQLVARVDLQSLQDQKSELETSMSLTKDVYDRQKRLWDQNIGSEIQYLKSKNDFDRLQKTMATLNTQLGKANIYAPISGVVDMEFLKAGELAVPGAPIVQMFNPNKLKITADIPETYLGKIKRGDKIEVSIPAINQEMTKSVTLLGRTIDPNNRTFKVEVASDSKKGTIKPNLLAAMKFNDYSKKEAITVPLEIVQQEVSGKKFVYTTSKKDGKDIAKKSYVTTGEGYEGDIIIEEGLSAGDQIIIDGARSISNGDPIKILNK